MRRTLSDAERAEAVRMWRTGFSLGEIARALGCSVYDLSPWLYAAGIVTPTPED